MNKAIFLDRDGIINEEIGDYVKRFEDFKLLPHLAETLKNYQSQGFLIILITNQGGLAKDLYTVTELNKMHQYFLNEMEKVGVTITQILAASVRHPLHIIQCAKIGADVMTGPLSAILQLLKHPLTDSGLAQFLADHAKANAK